MITEKELLKAISECEAEPTTQNKISRLADFYVIYDHLFGHEKSETNPPFQRNVERIHTDKSNDFLTLVDGKEITAAMYVISEFVEAVKALHPKMYERLEQAFREI
jgi:hypothetical protein